MKISKSKCPNVACPSRAMISKLNPNYWLVCRLRKEFIQQKLIEKEQIEKVKEEHPNDRKNKTNHNY